MKNLLTLICITVVLTTSVRAQKSVKDPRTRIGLNTSKMPVISDWNSFQTKTMGKKITDYSVHKTFSPKQEISLEQRETITITKNQRSKTNGLWKVLRASNGTVNWMWRALPSDKSSQNQQSVAPSPADLLTGLAPILKLVDPVHELKLMSDSRDELGLRHIRYSQVYKNIPVWNRDLFLHCNENGDVTTINGTYEPSPKNELSIHPSVSMQSAITAVTDDLKSKERWAPIDNDVAALLQLPSPSAKLIFYPEENRLRLAYEIDLFANIYERFVYVVDASSGEVIRSIEAFCSLTPSSHKNTKTTFGNVNHSGSSSMPLAGFTNANGIDLNNQSKSFRTYQHSDGQYYTLWDLPNFDGGKSQMPNTLVGGAMTLSLNNKDLTREASLFHVTSSNNSWNDKAAVSAHSNMKVCYDYYANTFARKAIDDKNSVIISIIHATEGGVGMDNAYWNGKLMIYGDGATEFKPLAGGLDVAAHEMTHGVIENTANLVYEFQPGALNESCADVFGVMVDPEDLKLGEDVMQPGKGTCLRDLENPNNPTGLAKQPAHMNEFKQLGADQDNGGVHINSGIPNRAAALIINALGRDKTAKIYYKALQSYMTRNSQFIDCRLACEKAATDLFGSGTELTTVQSSFAAVGIGGAPTNNNENDVPAQSGGKDYIAFLTSTGAIGYLDTIEAIPFLFTDPAAVARVSNDGSKAQLTTPRTGKNIWFVDNNGFLNFIIAETGEVRFFPNLKIKENGDLWNAAVSPDESYVALSSDYAQDPNIYIFDGTTIFKYELAVEGGDGTGVETIQYPDVMSWSPNKHNDKISFDAYNEEQIAGTSYSYWSMYEMNFGTKKIYNLIPAQPEGISVGNIIYSNTDPDVVAFNVIDETGTYDIALANFETGDLFELGLYNNTINGSNILDADKPSFAPNDNFMTFASAANRSLLFLNGANLNLTYLQFQQALYNPYWFLFNGSADAAKEEEYQPLENVVVYPTVFTSDITVEFVNDKRLNIECDLLNIFGHKIASIASGTYSAGENELTYFNKELPAGTYFVRLYAGGKTHLSKLIKQ